MSDWVAGASRNPSNPSPALGLGPLLLPAPDLDFPVCFVRDADHPYVTNVNPSNRLVRKNEAPPK